MSFRFITQNHLIGTKGINFGCLRICPNVQGNNLDALCATMNISEKQNYFDRSNRIHHDKLGKHCCQSIDSLCLVWLRAAHINVNTTRTIFLTVSKMF
jgi:hypothetical protein